eukprot:8518733-Ditylum_brightwellii.AAC.1
MAFAANQQQNEIYTFQAMLKQLDHKDFIAVMMKEIEVHEDRYHWMYLEKSKIPGKELEKNGRLKTILLIWSFKQK